MGLLETIDRVDKYYSKKIHYLDFGVFNTFIYYCARFFNPENLPTVYLLIFYLSGYNFFYVMIYFEGSAFCLMASLHLKGRLGRLRPIFTEDLTKSGYLRSLEKLNSMPSGDSIQAGYFVLFCMFYFHNPYFFIIALLAIYGRIFYVIHWIGDCVVGFIIGFLQGYAIHLAIFALIQYFAIDLEEFKLGVILKNLKYHV